MKTNKNHFQGGVAVNACNCSCDSRYRYRTQNQEEEEEEEMLDIVLKEGAAMCQGTDLLADRFEDQIVLFLSQFWA
jgi:hypothetical protein